MKRVWCTMESVEANLDALAASKVLVVGDIMLDRYWFGSVDRISPEAPVPVLTVGETEERIGGAGNVAANVRALAGVSSLIGFVGNDEAGRAVHDMVDSGQIGNGIYTDPKIKTTLKLRLIARNQQLLRTDFEDSPSRDALDQLIEQYGSFIKDHDAVVLSDYGKGALTDIPTLISIAKAHACPILVDPKGSSFDQYAGATIITPNLKEFIAVAGPCADEEEMERKAHDLIARLDIDCLLITLSEKGMVLFSKENAPVYQSAKTLEVYDVSGAGDTVIAVMAMSMAARLDNDAALDLANAAAGVVVSKLGTATLTCEELRFALMREN